MGVRPASLYQLCKENSNALAKARTSYTVAQVSEILRTALLHTRYLMEKSICCFPFIMLALSILALSSHPTFSSCYRTLTFVPWVYRHEGAEIPLCILLPDENTMQCGET